jgi:hypothetical protein
VSPKPYCEKLDPAYNDWLKRYSLAY